MRFSSQYLYVSGRRSTAPRVRRYLLTYVCIYLFTLRQLPYGNCLFDQLVFRQDLRELMSSVKRRSVRVLLGRQYHNVRRPMIPSA